MLGFQDFTRTNSYDYSHGYSGFYPDILMTTALLSDLNSPYNYGTIAGATPVSNANSANSDIAVVDSLLSEAVGIFQGAGTSATAPVSSYPSPNNIATVGSVGGGHQTGDQQVDSLLNLSDRVIADNKIWLDSLPKDPLTGMPVSSQSTLDPQVQSALGEANKLLASGSPLLNTTGGGTSMVSFFESLGQQTSTILNPNTTDAQLNQINRQNIWAQKVIGGQVMLGETNNSINKTDQSLNKHRFDSYNTFNNGPVYGPDWQWIGYQSGNDVSLV
ncbi:hypothetical protein Osc7112_5021 [Oscillatoria nigro-viridis PCC 7112]|uniref:Uncharacterized protein n=1 Tax=Phormidium nigroviride PCC 7112 TaxID=179408 RepID=K9VP72_9CYAN|nr:hypothetical protein [Oscillatoria nigro-viridis]AFZ09287.1 hypothetical protein Osc7112_5021 [Oscillatoria nigro-viridis PCC 7112]